MYRVYLESGAERDLRQLSPERFAQIIAKIGALAHNPRPPGCRKIVGCANDWRIRVGAYRVIYEIDDGRQAVRVMAVRHRPRAYRP